MDLVTVIRRVQRKKAEQERTLTQGFCPVCREKTKLVSIATAIEARRISLDEVSQLTADVAFHRIHNSRGEILLCQNSLERRAASRLNETQPMRAEFLQSMKAAV